MKITKEKIKEVEEEWQSNLLNWKSKRRSSNNLNNNGSTGGSSDLLDQEEDGTGRKIKTFTEILSEKAKSGHRLGYNLRRYVATDDEDEEEIRLIEARNPHRSEYRSFFSLFLLVSRSTAFICMTGAHGCPHKHLMMGQNVLSLRSSSHTFSPLTRSLLSHMWHHMKLRRGRPHSFIPHE